MHKDHQREPVLEIEIRPDERREITAKALVFGGARHGGKTLRLLLECHYGASGAENPESRQGEAPAMATVAELERERDAWKATAAQMDRDVAYYRGLVDEIGAMLGEAAYTADDGSTHDSVLRAKVPELVRATLEHYAAAGVLGRRRGTNA